MKTEMKINSVKLNNYGLKGIEVAYALPSKKNNRQFLDEYKVKKKAPIHDELEACINWLKPHLLNICGYTIEEVDRKWLLENLAVTALESTEKGVVITGELNVLDGGKTLTLKTPIIEGEVEYPEFGSLLNIITGIFTETSEYMDGKKMMSDEQMIVKFYQGKEGFDKDSVANMSPEEKKEWATKFLQEECNSTVFHHEDLMDEEEVEEIVPPFEFKAPEQKMEIVREAITTIVEDDDDFSLGIQIPAPVKSGAKKKTA